MHIYTKFHCTNCVLNGNFDEAITDACLANLLFTPSISNKIIPGFIRLIQKRMGVSGTALRTVHESSPSYGSPPAISLWRSRHRTFYVIVAKAESGLPEALGRGVRPAGGRGSRSHT